MDISNVTSAFNTKDFLNPSDQPARATGQKTLGVDDFLKLLTVQLTSQDPMKPMEDTSFISQMSSFTSLEQMKGLSKDFSTFTAQNYLGKSVTISTGNSSISGEVTSVSMSSDGTSKLMVGGNNYDPANVTSVTTLPPAAPAPAVP